MRERLSSADLEAWDGRRDQATRQETIGLPEAMVQITAPYPYVDYTRWYTEGYFGRRSSPASAQLFVHGVPPERWEAIDQTQLVPPLRRVALAEALDSICLVNDGDQAVHLLLHDAPDRRSLALVARVLRALVLRELLRRGLPFFHASCFTLHGMGMAVIGPRTTGKTTTLLHALGHPHAGLVSNDKIVLLSGTAPGIETAVGFPIQVGIRQGGVRSMPEGPLRSFLTRAWSQRLGDITSSYDGDVRLQVRPQELATAAGNAVVPRCRLDVALVPRLDARATKPTLRRLTDTEARSLWSRQGLRGAAEVFPEQAAIAEAGHQRASRIPRIPTYLLTQPPSVGPLTVRLLEDLMCHAAQRESE